MATKKSPGKLSGPGSSAKIGLVEARKRGSGGKLKGPGGVSKLGKGKGKKKATKKR